MTNVGQSDFRLRFEAVTETSKLEIVTDPGGMSIRDRRRSERYVAWQDVERLTISPPNQYFELHEIESKKTIEIPINVGGDDGGCEELLSVIVESADLKPIQKDLPARYGRFNTFRIVAWLLIGAIGAGLGAATVMISDQGHWAISVMVAAMWLVTMWYGGLSKEVTLTVNTSGFVLSKLFSRRNFTIAEISSLGLRLFPGGKGGKKLGLVVNARAGNSEKLTTLGAETIEAFLALRSVLKRDDSSE